MVGAPSLQGHFDGTQHGLFIMLQNQGQDLHHLPVAAGLLEQMLLQPPEGLRQFDERRAVPQSAGLSLDDRQIVAPVIDRSAGVVMRSVDDPSMLTEDLPLRHDDDPVWIDPHADRRLAKEAGTL